MIYIHIPFCKQKCSYCNFHFSTSLEQKESLILALKKEIFLRKDELENKKIESLYFGGGTPSILQTNEIESIIDEILKYFDFDPKIEITLEANPDDLDKTFLKTLSKTPVNRLSIGTQSFYEPDLKMMNRAHNASQAEDSIKRAQDFGFENLNIDLIYGSPTSNLEIWRHNLNKVIELEVKHLSAYALTVEPKTALENWIRTKKINAPDESLQNEEFFFMASFLKKQGFDHYEISNFGKPDFHSQHNSAYWEGKPYVGIGPSAHSYNGTRTRSWNVANNSLYIKKLSENILPNETEILSENSLLNEMLMIGLRTSKGIDLQLLKEKFLENIREQYRKEIEKKIKEGKLIIEKNHLKIPEEYWFFADGIASDLFIL